MVWADGMKNTDEEIRDGVWADKTKVSAADIDDIKAKTDNLPADPADESILETNIADLITRTKGLDDIHDDVGTVDTVVDGIQVDIGDASTSTLGSLYAILGNPAQDFLTMVGYEGATALANKLTASRAGYLDNLNSDSKYLISNALPGTEVADSIADKIKSIISGQEGGVATVNRVAGKLQMASTTIDLNQAAATYTLFTGTTQAVVIEKLIFRMPNVDISGGALTSISIQTDDTTPAVIISSSDGALANLTQEATLAWTGAILIPVDTLIQITIAGGASGVACSCDVVAESRAVVNMGYLS